MKVLNTLTGEFKDAGIAVLDAGDFDRIKKSGEFEFDWKLEVKENTVYKIYLTDTIDEILGLISIKDIETEFRVHINLVELSKLHIGKKKVYARIAGCLLSFACELAFEKSYGGFVSLIPKTKLIDHYCKTYGFKQYGRQLALDYEESLALIKKYSSNE